MRKCEFSKIESWSHLGQFCKWHQDLGISLLIFHLLRFDVKLLASKSNVLSTKLYNRKWVDESNSHGSNKSKKVVKHKHYSKISISKVLLRQCEFSRIESWSHWRECCKWHEDLQISLLIIHPLRFEVKLLDSTSNVLSTRLYSIWKVLL